jgi:hypothetical protein
MCRGSLFNIAPAGICHLALTLQMLDKYKRAGTEKANGYDGRDLKIGREREARSIYPG